MIQLTITAPQTLERAIGYRGEARHYGLYWTPAGDELMIADGRSEYDGEWWAWLTFRDHPGIAPYLDTYDFGSSDGEARHMLIVDRETRALYVANLREGYAFLRAHNPPCPLADTMSLAEALAGLKSGWPHPVIPEQIEAAMIEQQHAVDELKAELDSRL